MSVAFEARGRSGHTVARKPLTAFIDALRPVWSRFKEYRERRDAFRAMLRLDDHMLEDIGVSRGDLHWAAHLPLSVNASIELRKIAEARRRRR